MRRLIVSFLIVAMAGSIGVGCRGDREPEPTIPDVDFTPVLIIAVDDDGIRAEQGPRQREGVAVDPPRVPSGSVIELRNAGEAEHRLVGDDGILFDTGIMLPGETTTLVVTEVAEIDIRDRLRTDESLVLTVIDAPTDG
jgi:hypothetical protein